MQAYIAKRCLLFIPTLLMATLLAFLLLRVIPGDPALVKLAGETGDSSFTQAELHDLQAKLGTDKPVRPVRQVGLGHAQARFRPVHVL